MKKCNVEMREYNVYTREKGNVNATEFCITVGADNAKEARAYVKNEIEPNTVVTRVKRA